MGVLLLRMLVLMIVLLVMVRRLQGRGRVAPGVQGRRRSGWLRQRRYLSGRRSHGSILQPRGVVRGATIT